MKRITLLALALCLTFGTFAQVNLSKSRTLQPTSVKVLKKDGKRGTFTAKDFNFKTAAPAISNVSMTEITATTSDDESLGFNLTFDVTMNADFTGYKFYYDVYDANDLENFVDTSSNYSTIEEYLLDEANYYLDNGYDYWETADGQAQWQGLWGDTEYEIYVLVADENEQETYLATYTFTTPSSVWSGAAGLTVSRVDNTTEGTITWTVTPNENTRQFYFICESQSDALYWLENYPDYFETNADSYEYDLAGYWLAGNYARYFIFTRESDVNDTFGQNLLADDGQYIEGEDYVWMYYALNGNQELSDFTYGEFVYGSSSSLNDMAELMNTVVYPNPSRDYVNITSKVNMTKVELYNTLGQVVYTSNVNANTVNVPVSSLNNGTYFVKAYANNMVVTKKIVIE